MSVSLALFDDLHAVLRHYRVRCRAALMTAHPALIGSQVRVLLHIGREPGVSQRDLIEHSRTDKAQMARVLAGLEQAGWLIRTPSAQDKRLRQLTLSASGAALVEQLHQVQQQVADAVLQDLSSAQQQQLQALLKQILVQEQV